MNQVYLSYCLLSFFVLSFLSCQKHEAGVWALLEEADRMAEEKKENEGEVYEAMANSLSDAWRTLILMLEKRRSLLHLASEFFDRALEVGRLTERRCSSYIDPELTAREVLVTATTGLKSSLTGHLMYWPG